MIKNDKMQKILLAVTMLFIVALIIGATYAYFQVGGNTSANTNVDVISSTVDLFSFKVNDPININISQFNFGENAGNQSSSTKAIATLSASNSPNNVKTSNRYNIYFIIDSNNFVYTTEDAKPEILLKVTDPNDNEVKNVTGLVHTENGFDITTRTGGFLLISDYDIEAERGKTTTQEWNIEVTFVNLDTNQGANAGKALSGKLYLTKEKMSSYKLSEITNVSVETTFDSITTTLDISEGSAKIDKYYYGIEKVDSNTTRSVENVKFVESDKSSYTFNNLDDNTTYKIYSYLVDVNGMKSNVYQTEITTQEYNYPKIKEVTATADFDFISLNVVMEDGNNGIQMYYFSKDNGVTYEQSPSNSFVFYDLFDTTEYKIVVKVLDSYGKYSTEYFMTVTTKAYVLPIINSVNYQTTYNSISLDVSSTNGSFSVEKYYYSLDGINYEYSGYTYTFTDLEESTNYTVYIKVEDERGKFSEVYQLSCVTDSYKLPTVYPFSTTVTYDSISINASATEGDGYIYNYYYSKDGGSNYEHSSLNEYTFSDLTSGVSFNVCVYVQDSNGRDSAVYCSMVSTSEYNLPEINDIYFESTYESLSVSVYASEGSFPINKYYYTVQEEQSLSSESGSSDFVISGLMHSSTYTICVVAEDYNGRKSEEYCKSSETDTFEVRPEDFTFNLDNVGLHITFMNVDERYSIQKYYYSLDGSTYYESDMNTYTFEEYFEEGLTYQFCVKIEDHNGWMTDSVCESFTT